MYSAVIISIKSFSISRKNKLFFEGHDLSRLENWHFDLIDNDILSHSFYIYRQLHCWIFSFKWYPGVSANDYAGSGFQLLIRVKNPDLQDIRIRQTSGNMFGF